MIRVPIRYTRGKGLLMLIVGVPEHAAYVDIDDSIVQCRFGWAFRTAFDRRRVETVHRTKRVRLTAGVHGWRGHWLVNGASEPIVSIRLDEPVRAWVIGFPVHLRELSVSVADPETLIAALS